MKKTTNEIKVTAKTGDDVTIAMSDQQETFIAHWMVRFSGDFVADAIATSDDDSTLKSVETKQEFINALVDALNNVYGCDLVAHEYDYGAKKSRSAIIAKLEEKQKAKADNSDHLKPYIEAIKRALDGGKVDAEKFPERLKLMCKTHGLSDSDHEKLKAMFPLSEPEKTDIVF